MNTIKKVPGRFGQVVAAWVVSTNFGGGLFRPRLAQGRFGPISLL